MGQYLTCSKIVKTDERFIYKKDHYYNNSVSRGGKFDCGFYSLKPTRNLLSSNICQEDVTFATDMAYENLNHCIVLSFRQV
jgi:hypothetical protein